MATTLSVRLDPEVEQLVSRLAASRGQTKSEVIRQALALLAESDAEALKSTRPFDALEHLIGCVRGGPGDLSEETGKKLREILATRRHGSDGPG